MSIREKRHRLPRCEYQGRVEVVFTACLLDRRQSIADSVAFQVMTEFLASQTAKRSCSVPVYCLMPDHLHVLLCGESETADCYEAMIAFKVQSGSWLRQHRPGVRWQKDFYDHVVRSSEDYRELARYITANPCRAGWVEFWHEWPFVGSIGYRVEDSLY